MCLDVAVVPPLLSLTGESITAFSANCSNNARADVHARGFWGRRQGALFDIRVFHPNAPSYHQTRVASLFCKHELVNNYGDHACNVECESFTPLVFSTSSGLRKKLLFVQPSCRSCIPETWYLLPPSTLLDTLCHLIFFITFCCAGYSREQKVAAIRVPCCLL